MHTDPEAWKQWAAELAPDEWGPPASEADVAAAELRLGVRLPPGFRSFLTGVGRVARPHFDVRRTLAAGELRWLRDAAPERLAEWTAPVEPMLPFLDLPGRGQAAEVRWNPEHLRDALLISPAQDPTWLLLNPRVAPGGEWQAWVFSDWGGGADVRASFAVLVCAEVRIARQPAA